MYEREPQAVRAELPLRDGGQFAGELLTTISTNYYYYATNYYYYYNYYYYHYY